MGLNLFILAAIAFSYGVLSKRIEPLWISGPIIFILMGLLLGPAVLGVLTLTPDRELMRTFAELTLALVLFTDASMAKIKVIERSMGVPERLLLIGLPLTILLGFGVSYLIFGQFNLLESLLLAIILAPTDAALGKVVVTHPQVPETLRESLNVESGLNDGICVPLLLLTLAFVEGASGVGNTLLFFVKEIGVGVLVGGVLSLGGSQLLKFSEKNGWIRESWDRIIVVALALAIYSLAEQLGGSGFIACFSGGILFGITSKAHKKKYIVAVEGIGESLALATWVLFGATFIWSVLEEINATMVLYAILSLTLIRMLPVFLSLTQTGISRKKRVFLGWFGPRGLATLVFALTILDANLTHGHTLVTIAIFTIILSILVHGVTANPVIHWLEHRIKRDAT